MGIYNEGKSKMSFSVESNTVLFFFECKCFDRHIRVKFKIEKEVIS